MTTWQNGDQVTGDWEGGAYTKVHDRTAIYIDDSRNRDTAMFDAPQRISSEQRVERTAVACLGPQDLS